MAAPRSRGGRPPAQAAPLPGGLVTVGPRRGGRQVCRPASPRIPRGGPLAGRVVARPRERHRARRHGRGRSRRRGRPPASPGRRAAASRSGPERRSPRRSRAPARGRGREAAGGRATVQGYGAHTAYGGPVERTPSLLAALASAAVPDLHPVSVEALPSTPGQTFDVGFVEDEQHRRWVVRAPRTAAGAPDGPHGGPARAAGAAAAVRGTRAQGVRRAEGRRPGGGVPLPARAAPRLRRLPAARASPPSSAVPSRRCTTPTSPSSTRPGCPRTTPTTTAPGGSPTSTAPPRPAGCRRPARRWERALEDVSLWRFAPTPVHGDLTGDQVLAVFEDEEDSSTGRIRAVTGWEDAKVADPADDFAALVTGAPARLSRPCSRRTRTPGSSVRTGTCSSAPGWPPSWACSPHGGPCRQDRGGRGPSTGCAASTPRSTTPRPGDDDYRRTSLAPAAHRPAPPPVMLDDEDDDDQLPEVDLGERPHQGWARDRRATGTATPAPTTSAGPRQNSAELLRPGRSGHTVSPVAA